MPRPIHVPASTDGVASYTLNVHDEWELIAVTFNLVALAGSGGDNLAWFDLRDPAGGIIQLQPLAPGDGANMFYSLSVGAEPFNYPNVDTAYTPQDLKGFGFNYVSQRLSPHTLYDGCTLRVYKSEGSEQPPVDPLTNVSTFYSIPDLHLWVEDTASSFVQPELVGPFMLVPGPQA